MITKITLGARLDPVEYEVGQPLPGREGARITAIAQDKASGGRVVGYVVHYQVGKHSGFQSFPVHEVDEAGIVRQGPSD